MASWTSPVIHAVGDVLAATDYDAVANNATFLYQAPYIQAYLGGGNQDVGANSSGPVLLDSHAGMGYGFSLVSNAAVVPLTGVYHCSAGIVYGNPGGTNPAAGYINYDGTTVTAMNYGVFTTADTTVTGAGLILATAGHSIGLEYESGAGQTILASPAFTYLHIFFVGSQ